jgi:hypothetical protein
MLLGSIKMHLLLISELQGSGQETIVHIIKTARRVWNKVHDRNFTISSVDLPGVNRTIICTRLKHKGAKNIHRIFMESLLEK